MTLLFGFKIRYLMRFSHSLSSFIWILLNFRWWDNPLCFLCLCLCRYLYLKCDWYWKVIEEEQKMRKSLERARTTWAYSIECEPSTFIDIYNPFHFPHVPLIHGHIFFEMRLKGRNLRWKCLRTIFIPNLYKFLRSYWSIGYKTLFL